MALIDLDASFRLQPELSSGETVLWAGKPNPGVLFHSEDWYMIPFSLLWGGFAIAWEALALGAFGHAKSSPPLIMVIWGIPFVVIGQYMIWGRFVRDAWLKKRTFYGVTNRRILVVLEGWKRKTSSVYLESIPSIERDGGATGTLRFGPKYTVVGGTRTRTAGRFGVTNVPIFADIDDADSVYRLILDLSAKARSRQAEPAGVFHSEFR